MMFWWKRKRIEGLLAASLYEPLSERDRKILDRALQNDPALASERDAMRTLVGAIPPSTLSHPDLLPRIHHAMENASRPKHTRRFAYAAAMAVMVAVLSASVWQLAKPGIDSHGPSKSRPTAPNTLMSQALAKAATFASHDKASAYTTLKEALSRQPGDPQAGEAQWHVATMAFEMKQYSEALTAYTKLFDRYGETLDADPARRKDAIEKRDLLVEAERVDFASLQAYDVAVRDRSNAFAKLEDVVVNYQNQFMVADLAASEMARIVADDAGTTPTTPEATVTAFQTARDRCTAPVAVALLNLKLGDVYSNTLKDYPSAELHYQRAAESPVLANRANEALNRLARLQR